ncbi:metallophosphoesterase family protein [Acinetobacter sp. NIPH 2699]|uniref:metallophosphoesterase family protein n=1 Tax=Acinetobacter sp. NIPH 2699 TaxID=2923433 RepID=UPI001F4AE86F|nr:metallophosphoesterase family protein [Acinetobacter sp. NIPH 2699]MCH7336944.1 metallophosphoesterase [Acinetobacter sp. NIPH 2699]
MLLHLSDLHFGTERAECMRAIQLFCEQHHPEAIVVSGDLTQRARFKQFYACRQFLDALSIPYLVVPGNHDIPLYHVWNRFFSPFLRYQIFFGNMEQSLETEHFYIVGLNSIRRRYHTRGHISAQQIHETYDKLKQAPANKIKLVVFHQPFYIAPDEHHDKDCPVLGQIALEQWGHTGLFGLLHGHLHQAAVYDLTQVYQLNIEHPVYDIHAGTAISNRLHHDASNSFNVILANGTIEHYWFDEQKKQFEKHEKAINLNRNDDDV